jgi:hypothetical protein
LGCPEIPAPETPAGAAAEEVRGILQDPEIRRELESFEGSLEY